MWIIFADQENRKYLCGLSVAQNCETFGSLFWSHARVRSDARDWILLPYLHLSLFGGDGTSNLIFSRNPIKLFNVILSFGEDILNRIKQFRISRYTFSGSGTFSLQPLKFVCFTSLCVASCHLCYHCPFLPNQPEFKMPSCGHIWSGLNLNSWCTILAFMVMFLWPRIDWWLQIEVLVSSELGACLEIRVDHWAPYPTSQYLQNN